MEFITITSNDRMYWGIVTEVIEDCSIATVIEDCNIATVLIPEILTSVSR